MKSFFYIAFFCGVIPLSAQKALTPIQAAGVLGLSTGQQLYADIEHSLNDRVFGGSLKMRLGKFTMQTQVYGGTSGTFDLEMGGFAVQYNLLAAKRHELHLGIHHYTVSNDFRLGYRVATYIYGLDALYQGWLTDRWTLHIGSALHCKNALLPADGNIFPTETRCSWIAAADVRVSSYESLSTHENLFAYDMGVHLVPTQRYGGYGSLYLRFSTSWSIRARLYMDTQSASAQIALLYFYGK